MNPQPRSSPLRWWMPLAVAGIAALFAMPWLITRAVGGRIRQAARGVECEATWTTLRVSWPGRVEVRGLTLVEHAHGDTLLRVTSISITLSKPSLIMLRPQPDAIALAQGEIRLPRRAVGDPATDAADDAPAPEPGGDAPAPPTTGNDAARDGRAPDPARLEHLRRTISSWVRMLAGSSRRLPAFSLADITVRPSYGSDAGWDAVRIGWADHRLEPAGERVAIAGSVLSDPEVPFEANITSQPNGRLAGAAHVAYREPGGRVNDLRVELDGSVTTDRALGRVTLADSTRLTFGAIPLRVGGVLDAGGPSLVVRLAADGITQPMVERSLPRSVLGPLHDLAVLGSWDYRLDATLDLGAPDSVRFHADVIPHGLTLDPDRTFLPVLALDEPFVAHIHLPGDRVVDRLMSPVNPHYRSLGDIAPALQSAVIFGEDAGFYRHHGFSTEAIRASIADDLKAGAYKRGAGTITMQLARNLYLGHDRTMSRKLQEVVLAWVLEHMTGVGKPRMLELYLNIVEWGPDVHGADEAARFYFDCGARDLTRDQALFLAILLPSPARWRARVDPQGALKRDTRAQMLAILRSEFRHGELGPDAPELPPADSLRIEIGGAARTLLSADSAGASPLAVGGGR